VQRVCETAARLVVPPQQLLELRARDREADPPGGRLARHERERRDEVCMSVGQLHDRRRRGGARHQQVCPLLGRRVFRQQPQRGGVPVRRARRRAPADRLGRLGEHRYRRGVAAPARVLDVVGARRGGCAALRQRGGAPLVGAEPPGCRSRLVDRAAHQRVAEAEPPRHVGRVHEAELEQLVKRRRRRRLVDVRRGRGELGLERIARDGGALQHPPCRCGQQRELLAERGAHGRGHLDAAELHRRARVARAARELLEVERIAAALRVQHVGAHRVDVVAEQLGGFGAAQSRQLQARHGVVPCGTLERAAEPLRQLPRPRRQCQQHRRRRRAAQQRREQIDRRAVGPVHVVERQQQRRRDGQALEQRAHGGVRAIAVRRDRAPAGVAERREDLREVGRHVRADPARLEPRHVVVERVDEDRERQVLLELGGAPGQHEPAAGVGAGRQLGEQPGLADAGVAGEQQRGRPVARDPGQRGVDRVQLGRAPDEVTGDLRHGATLTGLGVQGARNQGARPMCGSG
jgi:hypothetical protein